ncbi:hypothetical protein CHLNCDRAFT_139823 [Chlorella variabilis]|uniref:Anaphase-promoting complex subunit 4 WD40 domain-containing protein n=1 Tax=Chlorella variabilis TaxID=554065 RepID=E1ZR05_CHLVA|nr:hypothetical protein CHLNCDRAFT_139823 [Chlorella variabilis]EFN51700.1 hypothetical protein CHLNCDRAFT_139823 [Chlorella variabilis]|eukprot:XP_005843802.1 hypothetical protein CHLNCDRAFT_139823 [Chlorella variabilis]
MVRNARARSETPRPTRTFASELLGPEGAALFSWSPTGDLLAAAGFRKKKVVLFDRSGEAVASLTVPDPEFLYDESQETPVLALSWHPWSSHLAILPRGQPFAMPAEVQAMAWSPASVQLALGTAKGGGIIWDIASRAATPLQLGRSVKAVCCMAWSAAAAPGGLLALGCKGGQLVLCRAADGCVVKTAF